MTRHVGDPFVTVWKRSVGGPIQPFDATDPVHLFVINTGDRDHFGLFIFPVGMLREHGVVSATGSGGKRSFRVYPPWMRTTNRQASSAQAWHVDYFPARWARHTCRHRSCPSPITGGSLHLSAHPQSQHLRPFHRGLI
ncbi:MepB family protein [Nocardia sp. CA-128927]|uniref:MepB family protein n=1 Tax=Nocardia sp. CA-128927 TaxID=3239975 RepID=UPI003D960776